MDFSAFLIFIGQAMALAIFSALVRSLLYVTWLGGLAGSSLKKSSSHVLNLIRGMVFGIGPVLLNLQFSFFVIAAFIVAANILLIVIEQILVPKIHANS